MLITFFSLGYASQLISSISICLSFMDDKNHSDYTAVFIGDLLRF